MNIIFTGDVSFTGYFSNSNNDYLDIDVKEYLKNANHVVSNIECPVTTSPIVSDRPLNHSSRPEWAEYLKNNNIDIWNQANNHILDCGESGVIESIQNAEENGCISLGIGKNLHDSAKPVMLSGDCTVAIISVSKPFKHLKGRNGQCCAFTWDNEELLKKVINNSKKTADWVVLVVHGGDEFCDLALPNIRKQYQRFIKLGADVVIGHHPHVVQQFEQYKNKMIFYSLGNFIFDTENQRLHKHTDTGVILRMHFSKCTYSFDYIGVKHNRERNVVQTCETPPVFIDFSSKSYQLLWPLVAKVFYEIDKEKRIKYHADLQKMTKLAFNVNELKKTRNYRDRVIAIGRTVALLGLWKKDTNQKCINYIANSW